MIAKVSVLIACLLMCTATVMSEEFVAEIDSTGEVEVAIDSKNTVEKQAKKAEDTSIMNQDSILNTIAVYLQSIGNPSLPSNPSSSLSPTEFVAALNAANPVETKTGGTPTNPWAESKTSSNKNTVESSPEFQAFLAKITTAGYFKDFKQGTDNYKAAYDKALSKFTQKQAKKRAKKATSTLTKEEQHTEAMLEYARKHMQEESEKKSEKKKVAEQKHQDEKQKKEEENIEWAVYTSNVTFIVILSPLLAASYLCMCGGRNDKNCVTLLIFTLLILMIFFIIFFFFWARKGIFWALMYGGV